MCRPLDDHSLSMDTHRLSGEGGVVGVERWVKLSNGTKGPGFTFMLPDTNRSNKIKVRDKDFLTLFLGSLTLEVQVPKDPCRTIESSTSKA